MKRKIVNIDRDKCNGCGICVDACHEGALVMLDGKATLISDSYCDGLGDCLPECPVGAITIDERDAAPYDQEAVDIRISEREQGAFICPSMKAKSIKREPVAPVHHENAPQSKLTNWPLQMQLAPVTAPYFNGAELLIAADCAPFAYANFHEEMIKGRVCMIGCPKLDPVDYSEKLSAIIANNDIQSVTVVRMEVPCCGGLVNQVKQALIQSGKMIPWSIRTISLDGKII